MRNTGTRTGKCKHGLTVQDQPVCSKHPRSNWGVGPFLRGPKGGVGLLAPGFKLTTIWSKPAEPHTATRRRRGCCCWGQNPRHWPGGAALDWHWLGREQWRPHVKLTSWAWWAGRRRAGFGCPGAPRRGTSSVPGSAPCRVSFCT